MINTSLDDICGLIWNSGQCPLFILLRPINPAIDAVISYFLFDDLDE